MKRRYGVRIGQPCPMKWEELKGDGRRRYCESCELHVHDLSAMSRGERKALLATPERKCGAFTVPQRSRFARMLSRAGILAASLTAMFLPACATRENERVVPPAVHESKDVVKTEDGKEMMTVGILVEERPLWKRILWPFN